MLKLKESSKILVIVAHPDDELLGLGGTIQKIKRIYNSTIRVVILGEGITSRDEPNFNNQINKLKQHKKDIVKAKKILGYDELSTYKFPDNKFDSVPLLDIIKVIEIEKKVFNPNIIFTHHSEDLNIDHRITFSAVMTSFRPLPGEKYISIVTFETPSSTEFIDSSEPKRFAPNFFVELNKIELDNKISAMESYTFEKRKFPHPRSPKALKNRASYWGVTVGVELAEAFQIIKYIDRNVIEKNN